jgi:hypothetical protein
MGALLRDRDWSASSLGTPDHWPQSLKTTLRSMLTFRQPIWVGWGNELVFFYNDAYKAIIGGKHPWALGRPTSEVWREIWSDIGPMLATHRARRPAGSRTRIVEQTVDARSVGAKDSSGAAQPASAA